MGKVYEQAKNFKEKYPGTISWFRIKKHAKVIEQHLNPNEIPLYSFIGQKNENILDVFSTCVICITNERILIGQDHLLVGYTLNSITPDLFNDMQVYCGLFFGKVTIDTVKETIILTNLDKKSLPEVETSVTSFIMEEKKKYGSLNNRITNHQ